jgi:dolichol-phosphate mannosyltransferase
MLAELRESADTDIVVASRYVAGGGIGEWSNDRAAMSRLATKLSRLTLRANLSDPMSGMFMLRREVLERCVRNLSGIGFKILVDIFASSPQSLNFKELPYEFRARQAGESKLDNQAIWDYVLLLLDKSIGHIVPIRFVSFTLIGTFGLLIHFAVLSMLLGSVAGFMVAQSVATGVAIVANYTLNNELTYRDMRLRGYGWLKGLLSFSIACSVGAVANVGMATFLFESDTRWMLAALAGVFVGAVWNYAVTMIYTWKRPQAA